MPYSIRKSDANQQEIVDGLRQYPGISVLILSAVGDNCPDLLVGYKARNYLFEVKNPKRPVAARELRPGQKEFFESWTGNVAKVETIEEILLLIGFIN